MWRAWLPLWLALSISGCGARRVPDAQAQGGSGGDEGTKAVELAAWPGPAEVQTLDDPAQFAGNLSGLTYQAVEGDRPATLWAVSNIPGKLYRLVSEGAGFVAEAGWEQGKLLRYPSGEGEADAEGVTLGATLGDGLYVVAEHDNQSDQVSRLSLLRYEPEAEGSELVASHEWNVTAALPPFQANLGIEALTWVPDDYLVERGLFDEAAARAYDPSDYPGHGAGLFFVGVEQTGAVYGFALDHDSGGVTLLVTLETRFPGVMGLEHDRDVGQLWVWCDEVCANQAMVFDIEQGRFTERFWLERPGALPNSNHEGIALGSERECLDGVKPFFWTDDNDLDGQSLRRGHVRCGKL
jgi:hypothetical protein